MTVLDFAKATIFCGLTAFLIYSFPVLGQILIIGILCLVWLSYAASTILAIGRR